MARYLTCKIRCPIDRCNTVDLGLPYSDVRVLQGPDENLDFCTPGDIFCPCQVGLALASQQSRNFFYIFRALVGFF